MAYVYKQKDRDGNELPEWRFKFKDRTGRWRSGKGWRDRRKTENHARDVEAEERAIFTGQKEAPTAFMENRCTPITELINAYLAWGRVQGGRGGRPWDDQNAALKETCLDEWVKLMDLRVIANITLERAEREVQKLLESGKLAPKSIELRVQHLKAFVNWCVERGYIFRSPLAGRKLKIAAKVKTPHRQLTDEEVVKLLNASPPDRRLWYDVALQTGFRVNELRSLTVGDLDLFGPSLRLAAEHSKDRKEWRQPITRELADRLSALAKGCRREQPLLGIPGRTAGDRIADDFIAAGVKILVDGVGKATWHSLRKVFINNVVKGGNDLKTIMTLARHSTATMSMEVYAAADSSRLREAQEAAVNRVADALTAAACRTSVNQQVVGAESESVSAEAGELCEVSAGSDVRAFDPSRAHQI